MNYNAIVRDSDGELISHESDRATQRLSDAELLAKGLVRVPVPEQLPTHKVWDKVNRRQIDKPASVPSVDETLRLSLLDINSAVATNAHIFDALKLCLKKVKF